MRYHGQMNAADLLTERQAAERIGWTPAGLRSHRERHELALLAEGLTAELRQTIEALAKGPRSGVPEDLSIEPWRLTHRNKHGVQRLNARGKEVARALKYGRRPTEPPAHVWTEAGVRYREADLVAWLDRHPAAQDRGEMLDERELGELLGFEMSTLKTLRYRARLATDELAALPKTKQRRGDETAAAYEARRARIAHLKRVADGLPSGYKVGRVFRYRPDEVEAWRARHPDRGPHPLLVQRDTERGALLTPEELAVRMRLQPQSLVGYRCRAGAAARKLATLSKATTRRKDETAEDFAERQRQLAHLASLADCIPPHVLVGGRPMYQARDVREWERRQERGTMAAAAAQRA